MIKNLYMALRDQGIIWAAMYILIVMHIYCFSTEISR